MRILVIDCNEAERSALTGYLQNMLRLDTVQQAGDDCEALAQAEVFRPDIVLLEWEFPGPTRAELLAKLHALDGKPSVVALGSHLEQRRDLFAAGADYFSCRGDPPARLLATMRRAMADRGADQEI